MNSSPAARDRRARHHEPSPVHSRASSAPCRGKEHTISKYLPWFAWLGLFYGVWASIVFGGGWVGELLAHWPIAAAMAAGSYFAGSTPMGGGTIGFPVLVLLLDQPAALGRDFSFAVQSIGMVSASILILCRRRPLDWDMLRPAMLGSAIGTPLGLVLLAPHLPGLAVKLLFAVLWASFGVLHLTRLQEIVSYSRTRAGNPALASRSALVLGLLGGATVAAATGVGVDMLLYVAMVLLFRMDLLVAIPCSVILMAFTSLVGVASKGLLRLWDPVVWAIAPEVFTNWIAAAPIVVLGAPLGTLIVTLLPRGLTLRIVSVLCVGQLGWTLWNERALIDAPILGATLAALLAFGAGFWALHAWGAHLERQNREPELELASDAA